MTKVKMSGWYIIKVGKMYEANGAQVPLYEDLKGSESGGPYSFLY